MTRKINDYLYVIKVALPNSPLRDLNSYVIRTPERNLLIDTGFNRPECLTGLREGIAELGLDMDRTDVLLTHFHADHAGLASQIVRPGCRIYMGEIDAEMLNELSQDESYWQQRREQYRLEGFPVDLIEHALFNNPAKHYGPTAPAAYTTLREGDILTVGDVQLKCVHTPGHTPGHICLYNEADKFMVLGDHVLFDITPNIMSWPALRNSLKSYMESLYKIRAYEVATPLPGHRECSISMTERIDQLLAHHAERLAETYQIVAETPGISGYDVTGRMQWSIRAKSWEAFPLTQKWFATGEALAHLYYLEEKGDIRREVRDGKAAYFVR